MLSNKIAFQLYLNSHPHRQFHRYDMRTGRCGWTGSQICEDEPIIYLQFACSWIALK